LNLLPYGSVSEFRKFLPLKATHSALAARDLVSLGVQ
jgi:hypothetical protein